MLLKHEVKVSIVMSTSKISGILFATFFGIGLIGLQISETLDLLYNRCDWMALVLQIQSDPETLLLCSKELSNFNSNAAILLFEHSNIDCIQNAELVINFKLNSGISYLNSGLKGIKGIHLCLSSSPLT